MCDGDPGREEVVEAGSSKWSKYRNTLSFISTARSRAARREGGEVEDSGEDIAKQDRSPPSPVEIYYPKREAEGKASKWKSLRNTMHFIRASRPRPRSHSVPAGVGHTTEPLPSSFSHLYRDRGHSSQPFQLGLATQEEIYEIMGEEVNLYLAGVNRRLSTRASLLSTEEYSLTAAATGHTN